MIECEGCKKLQGLCKSQYALGYSLAANTKKAELAQCYQLIDEFNKSYKQRMDDFQKEFTEALEEAEARAEYWEMKYNSIT